MAGYGLLCCAVAASFVADYGPHPVYLLNLGLHVVIAAALFVGRRRVVGGFLVVYAGLAGLSVLVMVSPFGLGISPVLLAAPVALYRISRRGPDARWGVAALVLGLVGSFFSPASRPHVPGVAGVASLVSSMVLVHVLLLVVVHLVGSERRRAEDQVRADAQRRAAADDLATAERLRGAAMEERVRVSHEAHDVVAHALSVVQVQAATALSLGGERVGREALATIREVSRSALGDIRSLVGMLREEGSAGPAGDLTSIPRLVASAAAGGLEVAATLPEDLDGWQRRLGAAERLAIVRATQEALTNAVRYAEPRTASVTLTMNETRAFLRVSNPTVAAARLPGYGLVGLSERLGKLGGRLESTCSPSDARPGEPFRYDLAVTVPHRGGAS